MTTIGFIGSGNIARAGTVEEAAAAGDLVVVTIPLKAVDDVPAEALAGKVVIDTCNYYPERDGHVAALDDESTTTSELVQAHLVGAKVVKGFNNIWFGHITELARPHGDAGRSALAIAGDDADAKATVAAFLDDVGFDTYDAGALAEGWRFQRDTPAYAPLYIGGDPTVFPPQGSRQVGPELIAEKLAEAKRYRDM
jgi:8-hydroxy-5-deazaflavin:NADPH oxidoreductase